MSGDVEAQTADRKPRQRKWDTGRVRPYRPPPTDFREVYIEMGWHAAQDHFRTNYRCIARWIEECGGEELREARAKACGGFTRPHQRSRRYAGL